MKIWLLVLAFVCETGLFANFSSQVMLTIVGGNAEDSTHAFYTLIKDNTTLNYDDFEKNYEPLFAKENDKTEYESLLDLYAKNVKLGNYLVAQTNLVRLSAIILSEVESRYVLSVLEDFKSPWPSENKFIFVYEPSLGPPDKVVINMLVSEFKKIYTKLTMSPGKIVSGSSQAELIWSNSVNSINNLQSFIIESLSSNINVYIQSLTDIMNRALNDSNIEESSTKDIYISRVHKSVGLDVTTLKSDVSNVLLKINSIGSLAISKIKRLSISTNADIYIKNVSSKVSESVSAIEEYLNKSIDRLLAVASGIYDQIRDYKKPVGGTYSDGSVNSGDSEDIHAHGHDDHSDSDEEDPENSTYSKVYSQSRSQKMSEYRSEVNLKTDESLSADFKSLRQKIIDTQFRVESLNAEEIEELADMENKLKVMEEVMNTREIPVEE